MNRADFWGTTTGAFVGVFLLGCVTGAFWATVFAVTIR